MKEIQIKEHTNNVVAKSNELITAKGVLSGSSQKMLASVISMLRADDTEFTRYALNRRDYLQLIGSTSNNDEFFKQTARELMQNPFDVDGSLYNWCSKVDLVSTQGYVVFDIHSDLKPYLLELKEKGNFTQYKVVNILSLKGEYSPRLYEYVTMKWNAYKGYHSEATSYSFDMSIEYMREFLQIPNTYRYNSIKVQIIDKAVKQFKEKTDIQIEYKEQKIGRKVDRLVITVRENNKGSNDYMKSKQAFISYMRANYINADVLLAKDKLTDKELKISVAPDGKLYDKRGTEFDAKRSNDMWETLFKMSQENKLLCLKQGTLF